MKNLLILISLFFMTVCYAAPPPDVGISFEQEKITFVASQDVLNVIDVPEMGIEAQEVAYNYIGYPVITKGYTLSKRAARIELAEKPFITTAEDIYAERNLSPPDNLLSGTLNNKRNYLINRQHSNYGYPLTAN